MKSLRFRTVVRHLKGRPFSNVKLERQYITDYRMAGVRVGYLFSWMAALSFVVFSLVEFFVLHRGPDDMVQRHRALMIVIFFGIGLHAKVKEAHYEGIYEWIVPFLILLYASAILYFESNTQLDNHPEFFYLSVNSTCILLTIASYYFLRLPIYVAAVLSFLLGTVTIYAVYTSGVFDATVVGRMLTYIGVSNAVGLWIRIIFDWRERKIFLQKHQMKNVAALRRRLMLAESAANQAKTKLLAMLSHEIRTPMNTVARLMGVVQKDLEGQLTTKRLTTFRQVEQACEQLLATLDDLLHFSATSGGPAGRASPTAFLLADVLNECGEIVSFDAREKGIKLNVDVTNVLPIEVLGQPHHLKRVVLNLLVNAIKFTHHGGVTVHASLLREGGSQGRIVIAVTDTGIGIPPEEHLNIFQLFYQVDSSYARRFNGSGLGLAISQQLTEAMGGSISVSSQVEQGSTFTISLAVPIVSEAAPQSD